MHISVRLALLLCGASLLLAMPVFADSTDTFVFINTLGNIGPSDTFTSGGLSLTATGYSAPGVTTDLFAKNQGANEMGLGLASGPLDEISGSSFIQLNLQSIFAANPSSVSLTVDSIQGPDNYSVWGSTTAGSPGTLLASNQTNPTFNLSTFSQYGYFSVFSPNGTVLIGSVTATVPSSVPEPGSASLLLFGLISLAGLGYAAKKL